MSLTHLNDLEKALRGKKLTVLSEDSGDDYNFPVWLIGNRAGKTLRLIFECMGDLSVLPIEECYACYIVEDKSKSLYFSKINKGRWKKELMEFVDELNILFKAAV